MDEDYMGGLSIRIEDDIKNKLYNLIKRIISNMYTESMLVILTSRLRSHGKIEKPQDIVEYMIREPLDFYKQIQEQFNEPDSADVFLKVLFDEISRTIGIPAIGKELVEYLKRGDEDKFREKVLEIIYVMRTRALRTMY